MHNILISEISSSLINVNTDVNRKEWVKYIIDHNAELSEILEIIHYEKPAGMRFSWLLGEMSEHYPEKVFPVLHYLFTNRKSISIPNFDRSLAKFFLNCGIPKEIEGEVINQLFNWLTDPKISVSTKHYTTLCLFEQTKKFHELKHELKLILEDQLDKNKPSFGKLAVKILNGL